MLIFRGVSFFISPNKKITHHPPTPCCNTDCPCARVASAAWATGCTKEAPYCFMSSTASSTCPGVQGGGKSWRTSYFLGVFRKKQTFGQNEMTTKKDPFNTLFQKVLEDVLYCWRIFDTGFYCLLPPHYIYNTHKTQYLISYI